MIMLLVPYPPGRTVKVKYAVSKISDSRQMFHVDAIMCMRQEHIYAFFATVFVFVPVATGFLVPRILASPDAKSSSVP